MTIYLLSGDVVRLFRKAWSSNGHPVKFFLATRSLHCSINVVTIWKREFNNSLVAEKKTALIGQDQHVPRLIGAPENELINTHPPTN